MIIPELKLIVETAIKIVISEKLKEQVRRDEVDVQMFSQIWGNTAGGFDMPGFMSGQAMTKQYTTVVKIEKDIFLIFFGNRFAYYVTEPNEKFYNDLQNKSLLGVSKCKEYE